MEKVGVAGFGINRSYMYLEVGLYTDFSILFYTRKTLICGRIYNINTLLCERRVPFKSVKSIY